MSTTAYDAVGRVVNTIDPLGNKTTFVYDALGRVTDEEDPLGNSATFAYDAVGRMTSATDRLGRRRDYDYDDAGRVETEKWYDNTPTLVRTLSFTYDAANNLKTAQDPHGTYTFTYDELNRADVIKDVHGQTLTFTFDAVGNRTVVDDSQGGTTTSTYNSVNLLTKREFDDGTTELRFDQTYTSRLQLEEITRYSNLSGATKVGESDFTYDDNGRLKNIQHKDGSSTIRTNYTYTYDLSSRIDTETIDGTTKTITYDKTNQLTDDDTNSYSYDANGNRDMTGYQTGTGNRMTNDGTYTYLCSMQPQTARIVGLFLPPFPLSSSTRNRERLAGVQGAAMSPLVALTDESEMPWHGRSPPSSSPRAAHSPPQFHTSA